MKIPSKEECFRKLKSDPAFLSLLKKAPLEERKQIINTIDHVAGSLFDALMFVRSQANTNSEASQEILEALKTGDGIIKESDGAPMAKKPEEK